MAYAHKFNPDALPAHAEPNEAARILAQAQAQSGQQDTQGQGQQQQQQPAPSKRPASVSPNISAQSSYQNKPPPPLPSQQQQQQPDPYNRPHSTSNASFRPQSTSNASYNQHPPPIRSPVQSYNSFQAPSPAPPSNYNNSLPPVPGAYPTQQYNQQQLQPIGSRSSSHSPRPPAAGLQQGGGAGGSAELFPLFRAVDTHGTGQLGEQELQKALMNDEFTTFDTVTVRLMIRMFDQNHNGTIGFEEFCGLWSYLAAWRNLFRRFDTDKSGSISYDEFSHALVAFGYNLSPNFVGMMYRIYDRRGDQSMSFDMFVQCCIGLKRMTDVFKKYDGDRDGFITLSFEEFLTGEVFFSFFRLWVFGVAGFERESGGATGRLKVAWDGDFEGKKALQRYYNNGENPSTRVTTFEWEYSRMEGPYSSSNVVCPPARLD